MNIEQGVLTSFPLGIRPYRVVQPRDTAAKAHHDAFRQGARSHGIGLDVLFSLPFWIAIIWLVT